MQHALDARARAFLDSNDYVVLATVDDDVWPRTSPLVYSHHEHRVFYWCSSPDARHSRNVEARPGVHAVVLDSSRPVGQGAAVWISGRAEVVPDADLEHELPRFVVRLPGHPGLTPDDVRSGAALRLYRLVADEVHLHVSGDDPELGDGSDRTARVLV